MDLLQQGRETIVGVGATRSGQPFRKCTAKRSGDPGLIGKIFNLDDSTFHGDFACGVLVRFN
ncbi:MAG: hypothetical protein ABIU10_00235 [Sphingomicrobium sp.]